jgi:hypothetical protein
VRAKRGADSKTLLIEVQKIINEFDTKLTLRQIYYQLVSKHLIDNVRSQYQRLSKLLVKARHDGTISWESIEDRTRGSTGGDSKEVSPDKHFERALNYLKNCWEYFELPMWKNQSIYMEVWFEKQALEGIFESVTKDYNVVQLACKGYSSHTMGYNLQQRLRFLPESVEQIDIVYFGDYDPSGLDIYRFIQDMSERFGLNINFERVAITKEQILEFEIPPMMAKKSDSRYSKFVARYGKDAVELDALRPNILQDLIRESIEERFDDDIYGEVKKKEEKMQEKIKKMIGEVLEEGQ